MDLVSIAAAYQVLAWIGTLLAVSLLACLLIVIVAVVAGRRRERSRQAAIDSGEVSDFVFPPYPGL